MMDVDDYMNLPYGIVWSVDWSDWRSHHIAHMTCSLREVPCVSGVADSADEALKCLYVAFEAYLADQLEHGLPIPEPLTSTCAADNV